MLNSFYMPTRIICGKGTIQNTGQLAYDQKLSSVLVLTDKNIRSSEYFERALASLNFKNIGFEISDECAIDPKLDFVDKLSNKLIHTNVDGVVAIGGGSVMGAAKAVAIVAGHKGGSFSDYCGPRKITKPALPTIMVPTTAGSGSEVSQVTVIKDDRGKSKLVGGGPLSFPRLAVLDPIVLQECPISVNAVSTVDAISHAMDSLFNYTTTALTEALSLGALQSLVSNAENSILKKDPKAMESHLLASSMANIACGNAKLGLCHTLSLPIEAKAGVSHGIGVGVLMPHVFRYSARFVARERLDQIARAWRVDAGGSLELLTERIIDAIWGFYSSIGFPRYFDPNIVQMDDIRNFSYAATAGLYGESDVMSLGTLDDEISTFNLGKATVSIAEDILKDCWQ